MNSPARQPTSLPQKLNLSPRSGESQSQEPILSLLTSQHPLLSTAINGSLSAYSTSKQFSPRFKSGAEYVERHIGSPVASTVASAGRISGVENGVRWWLQRSDSYEENRSNKRRRVSDEAHHMDVEKGVSRGASQMMMERRRSDMSLPPYDDQRSPSYEESNRGEASGSHEAGHNWQTRIMVSTSGLGVALREESLRSLKFCLSCLRGANTHIRKVLISLDRALREWNESRIRLTADTPMTDEEHGQAQVPESGRRDQATIMRHIEMLKHEAVKTLKGVFDIVSRYAGGALPEQARNYVHRQLTTFPERFRRISLTTTGPPTSDNVNGETVTSAQKIIVLASEGLDVMQQVSGVIESTIESAERWLDSLGRKRGTEQSPAGDNPNIMGEEKSHDVSAENSAPDVVMGGDDEKQG